MLPVSIKKSQLKFLELTDKRNDTFMYYKLPVMVDDNDVLRDYYGESPLTGTTKIRYCLGHFEGPDFVKEYYINDVYTDNLVINCEYGETVDY